VEDVAYASRITRDSEGREMVVDEARIRRMKEEVETALSEIGKLNIKREASESTLATITKNFKDGSIEKSTFEGLREKYEGEAKKLSSEIKKLEVELREKEEVLSRYGEDTVEQLIEIAEDVVRGIVEVMTDWRNVQLYRALKEEGKEPAECSAKELEYDKLRGLMEDPQRFGESEFPSVKNRCMDIDSKITGSMKELTISPVSGLWEVGNSALKRSFNESGLKKAFLVAMADIVACYSGDMLENPAIVERLRSSIF